MKTGPGLHLFKVNMQYQLAGAYIKRLSDSAFIPKVESNQDYQKYLLWRDGREETEVPAQFDEDGTMTKDAYILPVLEPHEPLPEDPNQYQVNRRNEYPDIGEQLDMIFHDIDGWKAKIQAIKDKHPKPVE